jgi:hypothetical protein
MKAWLIEIQLKARRIEHVLEDSTSNAGGASVMKLPLQKFFKQ